MSDHEYARELFAELTGALENATPIAAEGPAVAGSLSARSACNRLIGLLEVCSQLFQNLLSELQ